MDPGDLDQRITIAREVQTAAGGGGFDSTWTTVAETWARVKPVQGRERSEAGGTNAPAMYRFRMRRRGDLVEGMRITWNTHQFNIRFIADPGGRELYMAVDAETGVPI